MSTRPGGAVEAVVLAAGYGTRMGPVGRHLPKGLLPLGGRPLLDHLVDRVAETERVEELHLVTNRRFVERFRSWRRGRALPFPVTVIDDGTSRPDERLGAVGDLALAVESADPDGPMLVAGSDNVFDFPLRGLLERFAERPGADAVVTVVAEDDPVRLESSGVPEVDGAGRVVAFHEKPDDPPAPALAPPLYLFGREVLGDVPRYLGEGRDPDAPGHFLEWLVRRRSVHAWEAPGRRHDVGTPERYAAARRLLEGTGGGGGGRA